jgi:plasmid stabilization system protein ParE
VTRVIWTREAVEDVEAIKAYVARDSVRYAALLAERIVAAVARLAFSPPARTVQKDGT